MISLTPLRNGVTEFGHWLVSSIIWVRDQFTFLRAEHIRSVAFLYVCWQGERSWRAIADDATIAHPHFVITMACLISAIGLAWQATNAKIKVAGMMVELGKKPSAADNGFAQKMEKARSTMAVDDPEAGGK